MCEVGSGSGCGCGGFFKSWWMRLWWAVEVVFVFFLRVDVDVDEVGSGSGCRVFLRVGRTRLR